MDASLSKSIWSRDGNRCAECGLPVAQPRGLRPHTHHKVPRSAGGQDDPQNLITLCQPCHVTKMGHLFMLERTVVADYPQFVKSFLWEVSTNLLALADRFDPRHPPSAHYVIKTVTGWQGVLDQIKALASDYGEQGIGSGGISLPPTFDDECRQLDDVIAALRVVWHSHHTQRALDEIIKESVAKDQHE